MITGMPGDFKRNGHGQPEIVMPDGSLAWVPRTTTISGTTADRFRLERYNLRELAYGIGIRPDLAVGAAAFYPDVKKMDEIVVEAQAAAAISASATVGSAKHELTAQVLLGWLEEDAITPLLKDTVTAIVAKERDTFAEVLGVEVPIVTDDIPCAGTADRIYRLFDGRAVIGDLKTGKNAITYGSQEIACQLAIYSHGKVYDRETGERTDFPDGFDPTVGYVVHAPGEDGDVTVYEFDLEAGWRGAALAIYMRRYRKEEVCRALATPAGAAF